MEEWWIGLNSFERVFVILAFPFSLLTVLQLILELLGLSAHHGDSDMPVDTAMDSHSADLVHEGLFSSFPVFTIRNLIYFLTMFGWTGLACSKGGLPLALTIILAVIAGILTTMIIAWVFYLLNRLTESGNITINNALGQMGSVYITIPAHKEGTGVIQLVMQGATQELNAMTEEAAIPANTAIKVVKIINQNTVLVKKSTVDS